MLIRQLVLAGTGVVVALALHLAVIIGAVRRHVLDEPGPWRIVGFIFALLLAHLVEIVAYALLFRLGAAWDLGSLQGAFAGSASDYFYFSTITYTTVGFGDITPPQDLRIVTAVEALDGMFMVGVSTSAMLVALSRMVTARLGRGSI